MLAHLAAHPDGALARALRTPLMVYLARTAYHRPGSDPAALVAFTDSDTIEQHLLDAYLPAVYAPRTQPPGVQHTSARAPTYTAQQARRWLAFLADHLTREQTTDLAWWDLHRAVPHFRLAFGLGAGLVYGLALGLVVGRGRAREIDTPQRIRISPNKLRLGLVVGGVFGLMSGLMFGLAGGLVIGLVSGLGVGLGGPANLAEAVTPTSTLKSDRTVSLVAGGVFGLIIGLAGGVLLGFGLMFGLGFGLVVMVSAGSWLRLGVLRQVGAVYQFRHARLQQHLTALHRTNPRRR